MMTKFGGVLAVILAGSGAVPAAAQTFDGPYVGVQAGWNQDNIKGTDSNLGQLDLREKSDRFSGGGFVGYDKQITSHVVIGVEAGLDFGADDAAVNGVSSIDPNHSFDVGGRVGYVVGGINLLYVRGSYETMRARIGNAVGTIVETGHDNFDGWGIGGGVEREVAPHVSARLEYRYSDLSNGGSFYRHQTTAGLSYHF
jgi:outer membrane immunogenic protein